MQSMLIYSFTFLDFGNFLENEFWTPPPPSIFYMRYNVYQMDIIGHVAAAPGPLACPSRGAWPP